MKKPYEIIVPLFNDEENFINFLNRLVEVGVNTLDLIVIQSGRRGRIEKLAKVTNFHLTYSKKKLSPSIARNIGARKATADYIVFLDSDILVTPLWKETLDKIVGAREAKLIGETYDVSSSPSWIEKNWFAHIRNLERTYLNGGNIIVDTKVFWSLDGFDESLETGEDFNFCVRAHERLIVPEFHKQLLVHHEGNPKSVRQFIKREMWHAKGDLGSWGAFLKSKVMIVSAIYIAINFFAIVFLMFGGYTLTLLSIALSLGISFVLTVYKLHGTGANFIKSTAIMNFYLLGRGGAGGFQPSCPNSCT